MRNVFTLSSVFLLFFLSLFTGCRHSESKVGTGPESALSTFELEPGFKIELLAAEPLVGDPVDMEIDEYGRLYVVEMFGYPLDKSGTGKISLLTDTDGDGRMDKSSVFADGMVLPNSIMRWKKGVIVTDAPNLLYFEDADGDGKAEIRDTLLTVLHCQTLSTTSTVLCLRSTIGFTWPMKEPSALNFTRKNLEIRVTPSFIPISRKRPDCQSMEVAVPFASGQTSMDLR